MSRLTVWSLSFALAAVLFCYVLPDGAVIPALLIFAAVFFISFFLKGDRRYYTSMVSSALCLGLLWSFAYTVLCEKRIAPYVDTVQNVTVKCSDFGEKTDYGEKVSVSFGRGYKKVRAVMYFFRDAPDLNPGDEITLKAEFVSTASVLDDKAAAFDAKKIDIIMYPEGDYEITKCSFSYKYLPQYAAKKVFDTANSIFTGEVNGLITALLTGRKSELYKDTFLSESMSKVGISHVVAVSGMHVSFVIQLLSLLVPSKKKRAFIGIPLIIFFAAMTGFTPSVVRAGIMQTIVLLGVILKRSPDPMTSLSFALLILLAWNPKSILSAGLQLSFASTAGIIVLSGRIYTSVYEKYKKRGPLKKHAFLRKAFSFFLAAFSANIGALVFSVPLSALHFGSVSAASPFVNLLIFWAVSAAFMLGYISVIVAMLLPGVGAILAAGVSVFPKYIIFIVNLFSRLSFASIYTSNPYVIIWLVYVYALAAAVLFTGARLRNMLLPALLSVASLCIVLVASSAESVPDGGLEASVLNVGQGLCCVVRSGGSTAVIDCGSSSGEDAGEIAVKSIYGGGSDHVDVLILTHFHDDHINGVTELLALCRVGTIIMPEPMPDDYEDASHIEEAAKRAGAEITYISDNVKVSFGESELTLVPPNGAEENERCISVLCSCGKYDILITGDAGRMTELHLLDENYLPDIETLVVGHHGSKTSTSAELLASVSPEVAIISVGENSYGHPAEEVIERLCDYGAEVYRTDRDGAVTVTSY